MNGSTLMEIVLDRARWHFYRLRGCHTGPQGRIGTRARIDCPRRVSLGARTQLESDVWLKITTESARITIGDYVFLGRGVEIDVSESVSIGHHVLLAPGVFITDHTHGIAAGSPIDSQGCPSSAVTIEDDAWLGVRSVVLPGVRIGRGAVVGAGAVVTKDVSPGCIVAGVPARVLGERTGR